MKYLLALLILLIISMSLFIGMPPVRPYPASLGDMSMDSSTLPEITTPPGD